MKSIGEKLFQLNRSHPPVPSVGLQRVTAKDLGLQESWFRDAIFAEPELVIGPCRTAGRVDNDETWIPWKIETNFGAGPIDVLLVSSHGRIGIVETKLSYNPQKRREVVAQVLDYALALQDVEREDLPALPDSPSAPLEEDLGECLASGRFLLIIAGDALDPRALRLSNSMLARHLTSEWDLAMVDLNVYRADGAPDDLLLVPELLGLVQSDLRQVVRVVVQGESPKARIVVDKIVHDDAQTVSQPKAASVDDLLGQLEARLPERVGSAKKVLERMQTMASASRGALTFGLARGSANLYLSSESGPRRVVTLRSDGRFRVVLAYLKNAGMEGLAEAVVAACAPEIVMDVNEHAGGIQFCSESEQAICSVLGKLQDVFSAANVGPVQLAKSET